MQIMPQQLNVQSKCNTNFRAVKEMTLPARAVLECASGVITEKTKKNPNSLLTVFHRVFNLDGRDMDKIMQNGLSAFLYTISAGLILRENNEQVDVFAKIIKSYPEDEREDKLEQIVDVFGNDISIKIDDSIREYGVSNTKTKE